MNVARSKIRHVQNLRFRILDVLYKCKISEKKTVSGVKKASATNKIKFVNIEDEVDVCVEDRDDSEGFKLN